MSGGFELPIDLRESDFGYDLEEAMTRDVRSSSSSRSRDLSSPDEAKAKCPEYKKYMKDLITAEEEEEEKKEDDDDEQDHGSNDDDDDDDDGTSDDEVDPGIKLFLEHLKVDKKSYVFEMNGLRIKYEEEEEEEPQQEEEEEPKENDDEEDLDVGMNENFRSHRSCGGEMIPRPPSQKASRLGDFNPFLDYIKHVSDESDESYVAFLKHLRLNGDMLVLESREGIVKYDKENGKEEEDPMELDLPLGMQGTGSDEDDGVSVQILNDVDPLSEYKENLRKVIHVGFSMEELREKLKEAREHKQVERLRELRSGRLVSYPTENSSSSYLDYYPELGHMIRLALKKHNHVRALALLRCLFFYLKNLSHEGAFMPWRKESALKMIRDLGNN